MQTSHDRGASYTWRDHVRERGDLLARPTHALVVARSEARTQHCETSGCDEPAGAITGRAARTHADNDCNCFHGEPTPQRSLSRYQARKLPDDQAT
jgi:hypothetical protein